MTTRNFIKFSTVRPGTRHGAVIDIGALDPVLASGKFRSISPSIFELTLADGSTSILAIVHGSLCTESKAPQDALSSLAPASAPKRFARYGAIKASTRYSKYFDVDADAAIRGTGSFRFVEAGTLELTFPTGDVNLVLIARGYLYAEVKPPADALTGLIGASIGAEDDEKQVDVSAAAAEAGITK